MSAMREALLDLLGQFDQAHDALGVDRSQSAKEAIANARAALDRREETEIGQCPACFGPWDDHAEKCPNKGVNPFPAVGIRFRKRPVVVEARQWDGTEAGANALCRWANDAPNGASDGEPWIDYTHGGDAPIDLMCHTLEGPLHASPGDWIIRGVRGEFYPCKPDVFAQTYEPAGDVPSQDSPPERCTEIEEYVEDKKRLARELGAALGWDAPQPSLCDLIPVAQELRGNGEAMAQGIERLLELLDNDRPAAAIYRGLEGSMMRWRQSQPPTQSGESENAASKSQEADRG